MIAAAVCEVIAVRCLGVRAGARCREKGPVVQKGAVWAWQCGVCGHMNGSAPSGQGEMPTPVEVLARRQ